MSAEPLPSYEELSALVVELTARLEVALARVADLEAQLRTMSRNSSRPPSSDGLAKPAPKSLRGGSGRGPGRPRGQAGFTLEPVAEPDARVRHVPRVCGGCGGSLAGVVESAVERRQVFDLPEVRLEVTGHQIVTAVCGCGHATRGPEPEGVPAAPVSYGPRLAGTGVYLMHGQFLSKDRTARALGDLFGARVAAGTVASWVRRTAAEVAEKVLPVIAERITAAPVAQFDETGLRTAGRNAWMHSASTATDVLLTVHPRRGVEGMNHAGVLPAFTGVAVHDAWAPYDCYTQADHALCGAHVLRELVSVTDTAGGETKAMAEQAISALLTLKDLAAAARTENTPIEPDDLARHTHLLRSAVLIGVTATAARATKLQIKHNNLFTRLRDRRDDYLRFTRDPAVPFDNNQAEVRHEVACKEWLCRKEGRRMSMSAA